MIAKLPQDIKLSKKAEVHSDRILAQNVDVALAGIVTLAQAIIFATFRQKDVETRSRTTTRETPTP